MLIIRLLIAIFALAAAALLGLYWFAPAIATHVATEQLKHSDVELSVLRIDELAPVRVRLGSVELVTAGLDIKASGLSAVLVDETDWVVAADDIRVELVPGESSGPASTIGDVLTMVEESLGILPKVGHIDQLQYCQPGTCVDASLSWYRESDALSARIFFPAYNIWVVLTKQTGWQVVVFGELPQGTLLAELILSPVGGVLEVVNNVWLKPGEMANIPAGVALGKLSLTGVTRVPLSALPDELISDLVSTNDVTLLADVSYQDEQLSVMSAGEFQFGVGYQDQDVAVSLLSLPEVAVKLKNVGNGVVTAAGDNHCEFSLGLAGLDCDLNNISSSWDIQNEYGKFAADINASTISLVLEQNVPLVKAQVSTAVFDLEQGQSLIEGRANVRVTDQEASIKFNTGKLLGADLRLNANYQVAPGTGSANFSWSASKVGLGNVVKYGARKANVEKSLRDLARAVAGGFDISSTLKFTLGDEFTLVHDSEVQLTDFRLNYDGYILNDGYLAMTATGWPRLDIHTSMSGGSLNVGLPITNIKGAGNLKLDAETSNFDFVSENLSLEVLGGRVLGHDVKFDSATGLGSGVFALDRLLVKDMLALQEQKIDGTGVLSGSVPVQFKDGKVSVSEAFVAALAPGGYIRYLAEPSVRALAKTNPGVAVVLDAMEDFQYHSLQASVDYLPDGKMLAKTSVKGANPNYQGGRQVHLNLSLEENILVLLRSLRLGSDIAEKVSEKRGTKGRTKN